MRVLLVNPEFPDSYWSGKYSLPMIRRRSLLPPLGLVTVAALLPQDWTFRLIDLNAEPLADDDLRWADVVMLSGMLVQRRSMHEVLARCQRLGVRTVVGGPYATALPEELGAADHVVVGEAEEIVPVLARDLLAGKAEPIYREAAKPDMTAAPVPRFDLLKVGHYAQMAVQYSRGCPFTCEFCDIIVMYGRRPRTKTSSQIIAELDAIRGTGFVGDVFFVDDNFIGNKKAVKQMLPELAAWRERVGPTLEYYTEASMNIADDSKLMQLMARAGFTKVFIGIETPDPAALKEASKLQNLKRDMVAQVHSVLEHGLDVSAGFIVGFDSDGPDIFDRIIDFVQRAAIPYSMVGVLTALPNTPLFHRLEKAGRLASTTEGDTFGVSNIVPVLPRNQLVSGYRKILETIYDPEVYFDRCRRHLERWRPAPGSRRRVTANDLTSMLRAFWVQGVTSSYRRAYWRFVLWALRHQPRKLPKALKQAGAGHHFVTYTRNKAIPELGQRVRALERDLAERATKAARGERGAEDPEQRERFARRPLDPSVATPGQTA